MILSISQKINYVKKLIYFIIFNFLGVLKINKYIVNGNLFKSIFLLFSKILLKSFKISSFVSFLYIFLYSRSQGSFLINAPLLSFLNKRTNKINKRKFYLNYNLNGSNRLWSFFYDFLGFRSATLTKWYVFTLKVPEQYARADRYLIWQRYLKTFNHHLNFRFHNFYISFVNKFCMFFDRGFRFSTKLLLVDRSYYVPKINVTFFIIVLLD